MTDSILAECGGIAAAFLEAPLAFARAAEGMTEPAAPRHHAHRQETRPAPSRKARS